MDCRREIGKLRKHPWLGIGTTLFLIVVAFRMNAQISNLILAMAFVVFVFSFFYLDAIKTKPLMDRIARTALLSLVLGCIFFEFFWTSTSGNGTPQAADTNARQPAIAKSKGSNSPSVAVVNSTGVTTKINSDNVSIGGNNNGIAINGNGNQVSVYVTNIIQVIQSANISSSTFPEWFVFTNQMMIAADSLQKNDLTNAFQHANAAIQILEEHTSGQPEFPSNPQIESAAYLIAASSLDGLEDNAQFGNEPLANKYAQRALDLDENDFTKCMYVTTLNNVAVESAATTKFSESFGFSQKAISIYESIENHDLRNTFWPVNTASHFYHLAAVTAANLGKFNEAAIYANKAATINPSPANLETLWPILEKLGYNVIPMISRESPGVFILNTNNQIVLLKTNNEIEIVNTNSSDWVVAQMSYQVKKKSQK